jgi:dihydrofolate synthase/folylpolyglutamate synthase
MMRTKNPLAFLAPLRPYLAGLHTVGIAGEPGAFSAAELAALAGAESAHETPSDALRALANDPAASVPRRILIAGSLYLAGQVLAAQGI